jgi:hypothetical protein
VPGGYFTDGTIDIELGAHVFAMPDVGRLNLVQSPAGAPAVVLDAGGGVLEVRVTGQRLRENLGDAERYLYERLCALATSDPGTLGCEDQAGHRATFGDSVCVSATGRVHGFRFCDTRMDFVSPEKSAEPGWGSIPEPPDTYSGTDTLQDYAAGGVTLGLGVGLRVEMQRQHPLRRVPRARGSRARGPASGAVLRLIVTAHLLERTANLAAALEDLARQIGPAPVVLTENGNTFEDVMLESVKPDHTDLNHTAVEIEFIQQL